MTLCMATQQLIGSCVSVYVCGMFRSGKKGKLLAKKAAAAKKTAATAATAASKPEDDEDGDEEKGGSGDTEEKKHPLKPKATTSAKAGESYRAATGVLISEKMARDVKISGFTLTAWSQELVRQGLSLPLSRGVLLRVPQVHNHNPYMIPVVLVGV
jgi:hypothetical protein